MVRVETATREEGRDWAKALLAAAGEGRKREVGTEYQRGLYIVFVVPDDLYEAAVAAGQPDVVAQAAAKQAEADAKSTAAAAKQAARLAAKAKAEAEKAKQDGAAAKAAADEKAAVAEAGADGKAAQPAAE